MPIISVIMPVYNAEKYLKEAIDSILNQTLDDLELICVDDGSTDSSLDILNEYALKDNRVNVFTQNHGGGGAARNLALTKCSGKYLYCMDADDILDSNALSELYEICEEKCLDFVIFQATCYYDEKNEYCSENYHMMNELADYVGGYVFDMHDLTEDLVFKISVTPWSKLYNLDFVLKTHSQFAENLIFHDNVFFWQVFFNADRIYFYRKSLYVHRIHSESSTGSRDERFVDIIDITNHVIMLFMENGYWDKFQNQLSNRKIGIPFFRYELVQDDYKELFYEKLKKDLSIVHDETMYIEFLDNLSPQNKKIFKNILISKDFDDFERLNNS